MDCAVALKQRHALHQHPELSGQEYETAKMIAAWVTTMVAQNMSSIECTLLPFSTCTALAVILTASEAGPSTLLRCELDALPIPETIQANYRSLNEGMSHRCGHDGHAAIILGVIQAMLCDPSLLKHGRVVCLFQPAEETGAGAAQVIAAPEWTTVQCQYAFALHNVPGLDEGAIYVRAGTMACASRGIKVCLQGHHAHAAHPEDGHSPSLALAQLLQAIETINAQSHDDVYMVTVTYAQLGTEPNYGIAAGEAVVQATLRTGTDIAMAELVTEVEGIVTLVCNGWFKRS
jgi:amidohydrolase